MLWQLHHGRLDRYSITKFYPNSAMSAKGSNAVISTLDKFLDWWEWHQAFCKDNYSGPQQQWSLKVRLLFGSDLWNSMAFVCYISMMADGDSSMHKTCPI